MLFLNYLSLLTMIANFILLTLILLALESVEGNGGRVLLRFLLYPKAVIWGCLSILEILFLIAEMPICYIPLVFLIIGLFNLLCLVTFLIHIRRKEF